MVTDLFLISAFTDTWYPTAAAPAVLCKKPNNDLIIWLFTNETQAKFATSVEVIQFPVWKLTRICTEFLTFNQGVAG